MFNLNIWEYMDCELNIRGYYDYELALIPYEVIVYIAVRNGNQKWN